MPDENKKHDSETLHDALSDTLKKGWKWAQENFIPKARRLAKLILNEIKWIGDKSKESTEKFKQSETYAKIKDSAGRIQYGSISKAKTILHSKGGSRRRIWWYLGGASVLAFLALFLFRDTDHSSNDYGTFPSKQNDFSWIYGTWETHYGNIRDEITITEYTFTHANAYEYDTGSFRIDGYSLIVKYSNDPSGIVTSFKLDPYTQTISSDGYVYRKL